MATSVLTPGLTGGQTDFPIPFDYLSQSHVYATVEGETVSLSFVSTYMVQIEPAPVGTLFIYRETPNGGPVNYYTDGSVLVADDLNISFIQSLFISQELADRSLERTELGQWDMKNLRLTNVADPVDLTDAATKQWVQGQYSSGVDAHVSRVAAEAARDAAITARTAAEQAETNAEAARDSASGHRLNAQNAQTAAEAARDASIAARDASQAAKGSSEAARDVSIQKANEAAASAAEAKVWNPLDYVPVVPRVLTAAQKGQAIANIGGGVLPGFRNVIINPLLGVNQREKSGTVILSAGFYGHDRFKAGASGCTYTFSTNNGVTTFNISAGSLQQVIEASAFAGRAGDYYLSWSGTAQGRVNGGSYGASGAVSATCDGSANVTVEWGTGTLSLPQFERGFVTDFSARHIQQEIALCERYFQKNSVEAQGYMQASASNVAITCLLPVKMRAAPSVSKTTTATTPINTDDLNAGIDRIVYALLTNGSGSGLAYAAANYTLDAEL